VHIDRWYVCNLCFTLSPDMKSSIDGSPEMKSSIDGEEVEAARGLLLDERRPDKWVDVGLRGCRRVRCQLLLYQATIFCRMTTLLFRLSHSSSLPFKIQLYSIDNYAIRKAGFPSWAGTNDTSRVIHTLELAYGARSPALQSNNHPVEQSRGVKLRLTTEKLLRRGLRYHKIHCRVHQYVKQPSLQ
jgi:hypothetical protein